MGDHDFGADDFKSFFFFFCDGDTFIISLFTDSAVVGTRRSQTCDFVFRPRVAKPKDDKYDGDENCVDNTKTTLCNKKILLTGTPEEP